MHLHEYQAKALLKENNIPVPEGLPATTAEMAVENAQSLGGDGWMVKAQVHAGGRGKAGGVKKADDMASLKQMTSDMLGSQLVTHQTTAQGQPINTVLIESLSDIQHEFYLSMLIDRTERRIAIIASAAGGMDIEEVAANEPEKIITEIIDPAAGIQGFQARRIAFAFGLDATQRKQFTAILFNLYKMFNANDLSLLEINPLVTTTDGGIMALDAKMNIDDSAMYRHKPLAGLLDTSQEDEKETRAREFDLNYIALDGNIACMVNGAGLAMATMDLIKLHGGEPANFLDVGGGTTAEKVAEAFKLILSDDKVEAILVNIFGGIVRCDLIAEGIISAVKEVGIELPVIVRLEGTKAEEGIQLLDNSGLDIISAHDLTDAAQKTVGALQ